MKGVDLELYQFDFDLTFCALLMNADGTIYHTYGGRTWEDPQSYLSSSAFARVLERTLLEHAEYQKHPQPPEPRPARTIEQMPPGVRRLAAGKAPECYHCHVVHDFMTEDLRDQKRFQLADAFRWPDPMQIGLTLDAEDQALVAAVAEASPAAASGLQEQDRLIRFGKQSVLTFGDVQRVLQEAGGGATTLPIQWERDGKLHEASLTLGDNWKEPDPLVYSWRASKWPLSPRPGFGGARLSRGELDEAGLESATFALRIQYLVDWGPAAYTGQNALEAGLRKGDLVLAIDGQAHFVSSDHFHSWFRLRLKSGRAVPVEILREGERSVIQLPVID